MNILSAQWILMAWCYSTRASVARVLSMHPCVSSCLWVKPSRKWPRDQFQQTILNLFSNFIYIFLWCQPTKMYQRDHYKILHIPWEPCCCDFFKKFVLIRRTWLQLQLNVYLREINQDSLAKSLTWIVYRCCSMLVTSVTQSVYTYYQQPHILVFNEWRIVWLQGNPFGKLIAIDLGNSPIMVRIMMCGLAQVIMVVADVLVNYADLSSVTGVKFLC